MEEKKKRKSPSSSSKAVKSPSNPSGQFDINKPLDNKEKRFVEEYIINLDPVKSAIAAGYSETVARGKAYSWVVCESVSGNAKPHVAHAIEEALRKRAERTEITADRVLKELAKLGFSNMKKFSKWSGDHMDLVDSEELSDEDTACVQEITKTTNNSGSTIKIKLHDKKGALEQLGKHLKLFTEKHEHTGADGGPIKTEQTGTLNLSALSVEELKQLRRLRKKVESSS